MGMDMPVSLPTMLLYPIVTGDSGRHKHQRANYSRDDEYEARDHRNRRQGKPNPVKARLIRCDDMIAPPQIRAA
jgi:hypothetical protein